MAVLNIRAGAPVVLVTPLGPTVYLVGASPPLHADAQIYSPHFTAETLNRNVPHATMADVIQERSLAAAL